MLSKKAQTYRERLDEALGVCTAATSGTYTSTGKNVWRYDDASVVTSKLTGHGNGFWSEIRIYDNDYIKFQLHRGSRFKKLLYYMGLSEGPKNSEGQRVAWDSLGTRQLDEGYKLEVNLGKTFLLIDEMIAGELKDEEHKKFIKGIAVTDPENLKMIAGLKVLDEGMTKPLSPPLNGCSQPPAASGTLTGAKARSASESAWLWALNAEPSVGLGLGSEEIIRMNNSKTISFGKNMEAAIKKVVEAPVDGKAP